jgi:hypothetical protein
MLTSGSKFRLAATIYFSSEEWRGHKCQPFANQHAAILRTDCATINPRLFDTIGVHLTLATKMLTRRQVLKLALLSAVTSLCDRRIALAANQGKSQQMNEQQFWLIVEATKTAAGHNVDARPLILQRQILTLDLPSIQEFQHRYEDLILRANRWDLWGAAYLMNGGCSDDGFLYFRAWLISEGCETFECALSNPDSLAEFQRREYFDLEAFGYAALKAFSAKGGGELERDFSNELAIPYGKKWSESELPFLFPKLAAKYLSK